MRLQRLRMAVELTCAVILNDMKDLHFRVLLVSFSPTPQPLMSMRLAGYLSFTEINGLIFW